MVLKLRMPTILAMTGVALWLGASGYGMTVLWRYAATPGEAAAPPLKWARSQSVQPQNGRAMLVMFAHPQCPCSKASIDELAVVMAHTQGKLDAHVFFYAPETQGSAWVETALWRTAASIPGVRAIRDQDAAAARRAGAHTSGQTLFYSNDGKLLFNGGITSSRGHSGDNLGRQTIIGLVHGAAGGRKVTPVFGCSLRGE